MKIRLDSARDEPLSWQESIPFGATGVDLGPDVTVSPIAVRGTLTHVAPDYLLQARLAFEATVPCDRCLAPVTEAIALPVDLVVVRRTGRMPETGERELAEEELGLLELEGEWLLTEPLVGEQVQLNLPTHPLCREDCAGLCPRCGKNRNRVECGCESKAGDPRWAALAGLRDKLEGPG